MAHIIDTSPPVNLLFVDDDQLVRELARRTAAEIHYPMVIAASAEEAMTACEHTEFAIAFVDLHLPGTTGETLVERLRELSPATDVIIVTAYPSLRSAIRMFKHGARDYLLKPIDAVDLRHTIERCLQAQDLRRQLATESRMRQQLEQLSQLKSEFLANVSHEFRTPLHHIMGYAELLLDKNDDHPERWREDLGKLQRSAGQMLQMIERLLLMAQIDSRQIEIDWQPIDLGAFLRRLTGLFEGPIREQNLAFAVDVDAALGQTKTQPQLLERALSEILDNARKFTERGSVRVVARPERAADGTLWANLDVADTGPGIPAELIDVVFDEFRQVDGSSVRPRGGLGLGLALSNKLVELLGGSITVHSTPGVGSTFRIRLPMSATTVGAGAHRHTKANQETL